MSQVGGLFGPMDISLSALRAQRQRIDVIASNLANSESTKTAQGGPYQRQQVVFESVLQDASAASQPVPGGVRVTSVVNDLRPPIVVHNPGHPDADVNGNVLMPDIHPAEEMADLIAASRSYEANSAALRITRSMFQKSLDLGKA
jgi:flagellar basal-body rod protein FlgC